MKTIKKKLSVQSFSIYCKKFSIVILLTVLLLIPASLFAQTIAESTEQNERDYPLIPFNTNFWNYWDHYWMTWLDEHPVYEAIELTCFDNPQNPDYKLIRVFLSEKTGNKKQYFYLNDSVAVERSRANSFFRDIAYRRRGKVNEPQNLYIEFIDKDDKLVQWNITFDSDKKLRKHQGGLTSSIHSVGYILLYHLRMNTSSTYNDEVLIDKIDYAFKENQSDIEGKQSWYNKDIYSAVVIFGTLNFEIEKGIISNNWGRVFKPTKNNGLYRSNSLGRENFIEFEVDEANQLKYYQQISFGHSFKFSFNPPLPNMITAKNGQIIDYSVSFDDNENLMFGKISIEKRNDQILLNWKNQDPEWARNRPFQSILTFNEKGYKLTTSEVTD